MSGAARSAPRVGFFGGAFAPIHRGHLQLARAACDRLGLERLHLIPTARPPHRQTPAIPFERRAHWVALAIREDPRLCLDEREFRREGPSYSMLTAREFAAEYPEAERWMVIGADAFEHFHRWYRWREIPDLCRIAVGTRPGAPDPSQCEAGRRLPRCEPGQRDGRGWFGFAAGTEDISSSLVRRRLECGQGVADLLPAAVLQDITSQEFERMGMHE